MTRFIFLNKVIRILIPTMLIQISQKKIFFCYKNNFVCFSKVIAQLKYKWLNKNSFFFLIIDDLCFINACFFFRFFNYFSNFIARIKFKKTVDICYICNTNLFLFQTTPFAIFYIYTYIARVCAHEKKRSTL